MTDADMTQIEIAEVPSPPRPVVTKDMILAASRKTAEQCETNETDDLAAAIAELNLLGHPDGFEIGKQLDRNGWDVTAALVEGLDGYGWNLRAIRDAAEKEWSDKYNIQAPHPVGTHTTKGIITAVSPRNPATYEVKPYGQDDATTGNSRLLIRFEDVVVKETGAAAA